MLQTEEKNVYEIKVIEENGKKLFSFVGKSNYKTSLINSHPDLGGGLFEVYRGGNPFSYGYFYSSNDSPLNSLPGIFEQERGKRKAITEIPSSAFEVGDEIRIITYPKADKNLCLGTEPTKKELFDAYSRRPFIGRSKQIEIEVAEKEGQKLFVYNDLEEGQILFTSLNANDFENGHLALERNGEIVKKTSDIGWYGTHGACVCFIDFGEHTTSGINASDFEIGDKLFLEAPWIKQEASFGKILQHHHIMMSALVASFNRQNPQSSDEIQSNLAREVEEELKNQNRKSLHLGINNT